MRRLALLGATVSLLWLALAPTSRADAVDIRPAATAWWQVGPLALVTSAGIGEGELLVEGLSGEDASWQAVAGLSFPSPGPGTTAELRLPVVSATPPGATIRVCTVTEAFESVSGGAAADIPAHDCSSALAAEPEGDDLLVMRLDASSGDDVRVLLVPDGPARIVLDGDGSLLRPGQTAAPPADSGTVAAPPPPPGADRPPAAAGPGPTADMPRTSPAPPPQAAPPPAPDAAPPPAGAGSGSSIAAPVAGYRPPASDASARAVTAALVGVALGAFTLMNRGGTSRLRPATVPWLAPEGA